MSELIFIILFFGTPGIFGFIMARRRGKNPYLWALLSGLFPFFLMALKMNHKPLDKTSQPPPEH
jgi:hypothetical protein